MADNRGINQLPKGLGVDPKTGNFNAQTIRFLETLVFGGGSNTIGKVLSGVTQARSEAAAAAAAAEAVNTNTTPSGSALTVTVSVASVEGTRSGGGSVTTASVTITVSGGTGPYNATWTVASGQTFTATNSPDTGFASTSTTSFTTTIPPGGFNSAMMEVEVTDSAGSPNTETKQVVASAYDTSGIA